MPFFQGVRGDLTKGEAVGALRGRLDLGWSSAGRSGGSGTGSGLGEVDSPFLRGKYETWGEAQLRTKIRSHRDVGRKFYGGSFERYVNDD